MLEGLDEFIEKGSSIPNDDEFIYYLFFDKGIGLDVFVELPLPYIFGILKTHRYIKDKEAEGYSKLKKGKNAKY